jgi:murein DD-endopeptidase MepM/ murein hydrolase activator NlpD
MEEENLFETATYRYTQGKILLGSLLIFFTTVTLTILLVFYTPWIREMIPGYSREDEYQKQQELLSKVAILEDALVQRDSFLASLQRMSGDPSGAPARKPVEITRSEAAEQENAMHDHDHEQESNDFAQENHSNHEPSGAPAYTGSREAPLQQVIIGSRKVPALPGILRLIPPVEGVVTSAFNLKEKHFGLDLAAPSDAMIRSVAEGLVIYSEWSDQSGYVIAILHPGGLVSIYKHNRVVFKTAGSPVYSGEAIAAIGNTGRNSSGTHLHFELWYSGNPVNPLDYFALN